MTSTVVTVLLAATAGAVLVPVPPGALRRLSRPAPGGPARPPARAGAAWPAAAAGLLMSAALVVGSSLLLAGAAGGAVATVTWWSRVRARRRRAETVRAAVVDLLSGLAAELRGGGRPTEALAAACDSAPSVLRPIAVAARSPTGDPAAALAAAAGTDGASALADLAAAWRVVMTTGASMAGVVDRLAWSARSDAAIRREVAAQLAGPRATAGLLSVLPAAGAGLGFVLGADPVGFLVGSGPGQACLLAAVTLVGLGTVWTELLAARAESP